jgi:uncharacterized RDD family membrane protein YckC
VKKFATIFVAVACLMLAVPAAAQSQGQNLLFSGSEDAAWLLRSNEEGKTFDLAAKKVGEKWAWVARTAPRAPSVCVAVGDRLHMLQFKPLTYSIYSLDGDITPGRNPDDPRWPQDAEPLCACEATGLTSSQLPSVVVIVPRKAGPVPSAAPARKPQAATGKPTSLINLAVFQMIDGQWRFLAELENQTFHEGDGRVFCAVQDSRLFVMICEAPADKNRLFVYSGGKWTPMPLPDAMETGNCRGMASVRKMPVLAYTVPASDGLQQEMQLATLDPSDKFVLQPIVRDAQTFAWPNEAQPTIGRFSDQVAVLWEDSQAIRFATCQLNGAMVAMEEVDIFQEEPADNAGNEILEFFMWGVLIAVFIPLLIFRSSAPQKPFTIPSYMMAGALAKRIAAGLIDFVPFSFLGGIFFPVSASSVDALWRMVQQNNIPSSVAWASVTSLMLYVLYGAVMEWRFGWTLGKRLFKLRVVGDDGRKITFREALLRNLVKIVELSWPLPVPLLMLAPFFNRNRLRLGDMIARTIVIDARTAEPPPPLPGEEPKPPENVA